MKSNLKNVMDFCAVLLRSGGVSECIEAALEGFKQMNQADHASVHFKGESFSCQGFPGGYKRCEIDLERDPREYFGTELEPVCIYGRNGSDMEGATTLLIPILGHEFCFHGILRLAWCGTMTFPLSKRAVLKNMAHVLALRLESFSMSKREAEGGISLHRLRSEAQEAVAANMAKSQFLATISHEIRNPLGVILGLTELALDNNDLSVETRDLLAIIQRNGQQLSSILGRVLDISKIEAGVFEPEILDFNLHVFIEEIRATHTLAAESKGLSFYLRMAKDVPVHVQGDPTRLRQILVNLLGNAIKFTAHGRVELSVCLRADPVPSIEFVVSDTGVGIPEDNRDRLFQPYSQLGAATSRKYGGSGLGLMLSRQLARALGGELVLRSSQVQVGTQFELQLPALVTSGTLRREEPSPPLEHSLPRAKPEAPAPLKGRRVLLVEDSSDNRVLYSRYLRDLGCTLEVAVDGREAVEKAHDSDFDLIVMDIQMPNLDGHSAARALRAAGFSKPIVAITAHAFREDRELALANGFSDYLSKPVARTALEAAVTQRLLQ